MGNEYFSCPFCDGWYCSAGDHKTCFFCDRRMCINCGHCVIICQKCKQDVDECQCPESEMDASEIKEVIKCNYCTGDEIPDDQLIQFLLEKLKMTSAQAKQEYKEKFGQSNKA